MLATAIITMSVTPPPAPSSASDPVFLNNPYTGHPSLTPLEADVLWEYAKLAANVKQVDISLLCKLLLYEVSLLGG